MDVLMDVTPEQSVERLTMVADLLDVIKESRFNYRHWVGDDWEGDPNLSCGTTACALGWATTIEEFRKLGLYMHGHERSTSGIVALRCPDGDPIYGECAAQELFGLTWDEAYYLFIPGAWLVDPNTRTRVSRGPDNQAGPEEVAEHIINFIKWKWPKHVHLIDGAQTCA